MGSVRFSSMLFVMGGILGIMTFSGCSTEHFVQSSKATIMAEGYIRAGEGVFFPDVFLHDKNGDQLFVLEGTLPSDSFESHVIVKGQVSSFQDEIPRLTVFDSFVLESDWKDMILDYAHIPSRTIKISIPNIFKLEEKEGFYRLAKDRNTTFAFVLFEVKEKKKQEFLSEAEKIFLGEKGEEGKEKEWYRQFKNNMLSFYNPELDIQVDFKGESTDLHLFYTVLESFQSQEATISLEENSRAGAEDETQKKKNEKKYIKTSSKALEGVRSFIKTLPPEQRVSRVEIWEDFLLVEKYSPMKKESQKKQFPVIVRILFRVQDGKEEVSLQNLKQWKWVRGEWRSDGKDDSILKSSNRFFPSHLLEEHVFLRPKGFVHYLSSRYYFSVSYPQEMYYTESEEGGVWNILFSNSPYITQDQGGNFPENSIFALSILPGGVDTRQENIEEGSIVIPKSENAHFQFLTSDPEFFGIMQNIANTLVVYPNFEVLDPEPV